MKIIYADQAEESLDEISQFLLLELEWSIEKILSLRNKLIDNAEALKDTYSIYQQEEYLNHLQKGYQRKVVGYYKIIYLVEGEQIIVTDFFDTRQDPSKMKW